MNTTSIPTVRLSVNGEPRSLAAGCSIADLVAEFVSAGKRIAVERNGEIVPRSEHASTRVEGGDRIEIVVAVGGG